jgi:hypothetical protein
MRPSGRTPGTQPRLSPISFRKVKQMICSQCQVMNDRDSLFCSNCGTSLTRSVPGPGGPGPRPQSTVMTGYGPGAPSAADGYQPPGLPADEYAQGAPRDPYAPRHYPTGTPPGQYPPRPDQYPSEPGQYPSGPGQYPPGPGQYPPGPGQYPPGPGQYPSGPGQYPSSAPAGHFSPDPMGGHYSTGAHAPRAHAPAQAFHLDLRRLSRVDQTVAGASLVVLISLFLPWYGFSALGSTATISGTSTHGFLVLDVILAIVLIAYLVLRSGWDEFPVNLPVAHAPLLLIGTGLQFLLVLIGFLDEPTGLSWEIGAYLALLASAAAAGPVIIPAIRSWQASR